jgi:hypothetical protein
MWRALERLERHAVVLQVIAAVASCLAAAFAAYATYRQAVYAGEQLAQSELRIRIFGIAGPPTKFAFNGREWLSALPSEFHITGNKDLIRSMSVKYISYFKFIPHDQGFLHPPWLMKYLTAPSRFDRLETHDVSIPSPYNCQDRFDDSGPSLIDCKLLSAVEAIPDPVAIVNQCRGKDYYYFVMGPNTIFLISYEDYRSTSHTVVAELESHGAYKYYYDREAAREMDRFRDIELSNGFGRGTYFLDTRFPSSSLAMQLEANSGSYAPQLRYLEWNLIEALKYYYDCVAKFPAPDKYRWRRRLGEMLRKDR